MKSRSNKFTGECHETLKGKLIPMLLKLFQKVETLVKSSYKSNRITKPDKVSTVFNEVKLMLPQKSLGIQVVT